METTKKCPYCGEEILAVAKKCKHCGEWLEQDENPIATTTTGETKNSINADNPTKEPKPIAQVSDVDVETSANVEIPENEQEYYEKGFASYYCNRIFKLHRFDTKGGVSRSEYWKFILCMTFINFMLLSATPILNLQITVGSTTKALLFSLFFLGLTFFYSVMSICMMIRRLHDVDKSGWLWLLVFVPIANLYLIYLLCTKGKEKDANAPILARDIVQLVFVVFLSIIFFFVGNYLNAELADDTTPSYGNELLEDNSILMEDNSELMEEGYSEYE